MPTNRRRFLKYAGATAAVVGASALGLEYLVGPRMGNLNQTPTTGTTSSLDRTPPTIKDFQWQPTRVVNGKVYNATISFSVEDQESAIADVSATLGDYAPTIPSRAYPAEPARTLQLTQSQTGNASVTYAGQVTDLKGGKEYQFTVNAQDSRNNKTTAQFETPYVREFESIAGRDQVLVGAYYYAWYTNPCRSGVFCHWKEDAAGKDGTTPNGTPLIGLYNSDDPLVISKHIDWMTGHGIDFLILDWWGVDNSDHEFINNVNLELVLGNPLASETQFSVIYESGHLVNLRHLGIDFDDSGVLSLFVNDMSYLARNYLSNPRFLRIQNRPVVFLYATQSYKGNVASAVRQARDQMKQAIGMDPYLVGLHDGLQDPQPNLIDPYDAACNWVNMFWGDNREYHNEIRTQQHDSRWLSYAHSRRREFVPSALAGFHRVVPDFVTGAWLPVLQKSPQRFVKQLQIALKYLDTSNNMLVVPTFNDWAENAQIEPSVEDGLKYLETLRDALAGH